MYATAGLQAFSGEIRVRSTAIFKHCMLHIHLLVCAGLSFGPTVRADMKHSLSPHLSYVALLRLHVM